MNSKISGLEAIPWFVRPVAVTSCSVALFVVGPMLETLNPTDISNPFLQGVAVYAAIVVAMSIALAAPLWLLAACGLDLSVMIAGRPQRRPRKLAVALAIVALLAGPFLLDAMRPRRKPPNTLACALALESLRRTSFDMLQAYNFEGLLKLIR